MLLRTAINAARQQFHDVLKSSLPSPLVASSGVAEWPALSSACQAVRDGANEVTEQIHLRNEEVGSFQDGGKQWQEDGGPEASVAVDCFLLWNQVTQSRRGEGSWPTHRFTYKPAIAILGAAAHTELTAAFTFLRRGWVSKERWGSESPSLGYTKKSDPSCRSTLSEQRMHVLHDGSYSLKTRSSAWKADKCPDWKENGETGEWFANERGPT